MTDFDPYSPAYTKLGKAVFVQARTKDGGYVVADAVEVQGYDGETTLEMGQIVTIERELFKEPPRTKYDEEIVRLRSEKDALSQENTKLKIEAFNAEKDVKARLDKLKKYKGLEYLEDFIEGRVTHFILDHTNNYRIVTLEDDDMHQTDRWGCRLKREGLKLISLFGQSNGDLTWKVNQYRDGSGSIWSEIVPCTSHEDAVERRRILIADQLSDALGYSGTDKEYKLLSAIRRAVEFGVPITAQQQALLDAQVQATTAAKKQKLQKVIDDAQTELSHLEQLP